jgi:two-component system nitrate/nitrite response regulator NarL
VVTHSTGRGVSGGVFDWPVLIVSEIRFLREGLAEALKREPPHSVVGLAANVDEMLAAVDQSRPAIVLLDAAFPNGTAAVRDIRAVGPAVRVVVFAVMETEENIVGWAEAGAAGYIPATAGLGDLVRLLADVVQGEQICSGRVASGLMRRVAFGAKTRDERNRTKVAPILTTREREISRLVSAGLSNKEIARQLNIELSTTKSHVHNLLGKLQLRRRGQIAYWIREHQISPF